MSYQKDKIALQKVVSKYRAHNEELKRVNDVNTRIVTRGRYIGELMNLTNSTNENIRSLAPTFIFPVIQLFETQQANDNKLLAGAAPKTQDDENAKLQAYKTVLTNAVNKISKFPSKDEQYNKYFELSKSQREILANIPEPLKTKALNIANPILIPAEDKSVEFFKDKILEIIKGIEAIKDEKTKNQVITQFISKVNTIITGIHEPIKSKAKAMFDPILKDLNQTSNIAATTAAALTKAMQVEYDKFMSAIGLKTNEVNASSKYINDTQSTIKSLVSQATSSIDTLKLKVSEISTNVSQSNASLATLRTYITTVADNVTKSTQSLAEASNATEEAKIYRNEAERYRNEAMQFKDLTNQELIIARGINTDISNELVQAKNLMDGTAKALRGANSTAGSENIIQVIRPKEATKTSTTGSQGFANINEGFEDYTTYTPEELRRYALVQTYIGRENSARTRMLQASELLAQKESVANNIVMDYMYANEKGTTVNTIMDRITQLNNDKKRKLEINTYYNKAREQYIRILIVIVIACIIIVPLVIANKNNNISHLTFMILTVTIIFFTIIFIFYNFADIYMRDDVDFDKINIPYDRTATHLERDGSLIRKKNPLTSLTLTCIGQDCCDGSMVYDYAKNKCIATENFGNMFEQFNAMNNVQSIVYPNEGFINNSNFKNNMMQTSFGCSSIDQFMTNDCRRPVEAVL
jgi:septal ring factor EnvC (AmiA/AmiB activator)